MSWTIFPAPSYPPDGKLSRRMGIKWAEEVFDQCEQLRSHPESGRIVPEFGRPEIRELIHGNFRLIYEVKTKQIDMLTIWHTSQELPSKPE